MEMTRVSMDRMSDPFTDHPSNGYFDPAPQPQISIQVAPNHYIEAPPDNATHFDNDPGYVPNHFIEDLDRRFPRIAVSPSMLSTYSFMRAKDTVHNDPLHSALYIHPSRNYHDQRRMRLELVARRHSIQSLPKHTTFFWDPVDEQPRLEIPFVPFDPYKPPPSNITYQEHLRQFPPSVGTNHYKGKMVWANFGYIKIRGRWVDPDSEGDIADAYNAYASGDDEAPYLPDLQKIPDLGPRIMGPEEESEFYPEYTAEVSDESDGEGDPRLYRITPATFARWAVGCGSGERYEERQFVPGPKLPLPDPKYEAEIRPKPRPHLQYDVETGSVLSGLYETDPEPRVLHTPQGVNVVRPPAVFTYSYPQTAIDLDLQAFVNGQMYGPESSIASTPEVFSSENGILNIAPKLGDLQTGEQIYEGMRAQIGSLRQEIHAGTARLFLKADAAKATAEQRIHLGREVFFLKGKISSLPPPQTLSTLMLTSTSSPSLNSTQCNGQIDGTHSPRSPAKPRLRRRKQYQRYIREELEREEMAINKTREYTKRLEDEHQDILDEIEKLQVEKDMLLGQLGVLSISDLPGLIPKKESSGRDLRAQFGLEEV
ncbi:hypothetical protein BKA65DRAFT_219461 [Rhexocercosporidium sp. MPI-PUGE-AT-0058]|nr:hypothetical protein BKA65DRAFT_219461 [Rhexocercosporidium sp. MPI-PUGE-AT-0058]